MDKVVSRNPNIYILSRLSCCLRGAALQLLDVLLLVDGVDLPCRISYSVVHQTMKFPQHIVSPPWNRLGEQHGRCFRSKWDQEAFPAQLPWNALVALAVSFILSKRSGFKNSLISTKKSFIFNCFQKFERGKGRRERKLCKFWKTIARHARLCCSPALQHHLFFLHPCDPFNTSLCIWQALHRRRQCTHKTYL